MNIQVRFLKPAAAHVLMVSFLLGGVGALIIGLQQSLKTAENAIRPALKVAVFIQSSVTDSEAEQWSLALPKLDPEIASVDYVSRTEALRRAQGNPALMKALLLLQENPLPASAVLHFNDAAWMERPEPAIKIKNQAQIQEIRWDPEARSLFRSLRQWRAWLMRLTGFAMMMLFVWCFFGVYRFFSLRASMSELFAQLGLGFIGGSLAVITWGLALRGIGSDAALYRPETISFWPLLSALMAALATFGWQVSNSHD